MIFHVIKDVEIMGEYYVILTCEYKPYIKMCLD